MNLQQLRCIREAVRQELNLTRAAAKLHTSQPGVSRQIMELEEELGVEIFVRRGKRIVALTEPGEEVAKIVDRVLDEVGNLKGLGQAFANQDSGSLAIATTHTQARYALPAVVAAFKSRYPKVHLSLIQGSPQQLAEMVLAGDADLAIATESLAEHPQLLALPASTWQHCVIVPKGHPLSRRGRLALDELARQPLITYDPAFTGRATIDAAFAAQSLKPDVVLSAIDADVIKTYVRLGLGVGIVARMAFDPKQDRGLRMRDAGHLFGSHTTRLALRRGRLLRRYVYEFIKAFAPHLSRQVIEAGSRAVGREAPRPEYEI